MALLRTEQQQQRRRRRPHRVGCILSTFVICIVLLSSCCHNVGAIEIEVTKDWQVIGENQTIPAGVHVRMDMTTGEKWVKLVDDTDDNTGIQEVEVQQSSGGIMLVENKDESTTKKDPTFDFEMMHRTLSKLPEEEHARMGGLPELPGSVTAPEQTKTPEYKAMFEKRMREIWTQRQAELKAFEDEYLVDLPDLLKERIRRLKEYLEDPYANLVAMDLQRKSNEEDDSEETHVTDILSVLQDLEYHLADVDMTRDFHTMGGWPLLVAMVDPAGHHANETITVDLRSNVRTVQMHAAWAIGTAIKNTGEFYPYAIEEVLVKGEKTTALKMLLKQFQVETDTDPALQQKVIYGISSLLRGNRPAQAYFLDLGGPDILAQSLIRLEPKLIKRVLTLVEDIVSDVKRHGNENDEGIGQKVVSSFSHPIFCQLTVDGLKSEHLVQTAMQTLKAIAGTCDWESRSKVAGAIDEAEEAWKSLIVAPDLLDDLVVMADETKKIVMGF